MVLSSVHPFPDHIPTNFSITASREKWAGNNTERVKELWQLWQIYHAENRESEYNQIEGDCQVCWCKVKKETWARHVKTEKHRKGVEGGGSDGKVFWGYGGGKGWTVLSTMPLSLLFPTVWGKNGCWGACTSRSRIFSGFAGCLAAWKPLGSHAMPCIYFYSWFHNTVDSG